MNAPTVASPRLYSSTCWRRWYCRAGHPQSWSWLHTVQSWADYGTGPEGQERAAHEIVQKVLIEKETLALQS